MTDYNLSFNLANGEGVCVIGSPDGLLSKLLLERIGHSKFKVLDNVTLHEIAIGYNECVQFLLNECKHFTIAVMVDDKVQSLVEGPVKHVQHYMLQNSDIMSNMVLVVKCSFDSHAAIPLAMRNNDVYRVLKNWFTGRVNNTNPKKPESNWKEMFITSELERIEDIIRSGETAEAMERIRTLVQAVQ